MALLKLSNQIVMLRGQCGGIYYKRGADGQHVQAMPRHVNYARSVPQMFGISAWTGMSAIWMMGLLAVFGAAWAAYALIFLFTTKDGEKKRITGYNWFMHYAMRFPEAEPLPFWKPPHAPGDLPHYYVVYKGMWQYEHGPDEWPAECPADYYWESPIPWNGKPAYRSDDYEWHIWWKDPVWCISRGPGWEEPGMTFYSPDDNIEAYYKNPVSKTLSRVYFGGHKD